MKIMTDKFVNMKKKKINLSKHVIWMNQQPKYLSSIRTVAVNVYSIIAKGKCEAICSISILNTVKTSTRPRNAKKDKFMKKF